MTVCFKFARVEEAKTLLALLADWMEREIMHVKGILSNTANQREKK